MRARSFVFVGSLLLTFAVVASAATTECAKRSVMGYHVGMTREEATSVSSGTTDALSFDKAGQLISFERTVEGADIEALHSEISANLQVIAKDVYDKAEAAGSSQRLVHSTWTLTGCDQVVDLVVSYAKNGEARAKIAVRKLKQ